MVVGPIAARLLAASAVTAAGARAEAAGATRSSIAGMQAALELIEKEETVMVPVSSSALSSIGFDPESEQIIVVFNRGGTYSYPGSESLFNQFLVASSKGQFFNQYIRPRG